MLINVIRNSTPWAKFIFALFILLTVFTTFMLVSEIIAHIFFNISFLQIDLSLVKTDSKALFTLKIGQLLQSLGLFVIPSIVIALVMDGSVKNFLSLKYSTQTSAYWKGIIIILVSIPFINFLSDFNQMMQIPSALNGIEEWMKIQEEKINEIYKLFVGNNSLENFALNILIMVLIPAIGEEFLFRGVFQRMFTALFKNIHWGIWISAFLFSAMHMQFYSFLPRFYFGLLFGYMVVWTGSLWIPILMHFINNLMTVTYENLLSRGFSNKMDTIGKMNDMVWLVIPSVAILFFLIMNIRKRHIVSSTPSL